jgi:uncharacterized protein YbaP (TraB family)
MGCRPEAMLAGVRLNTLGIEANLLSSLALLEWMVLSFLMTSVITVRNYRDTYGIDYYPYIKEYMF